MGTWADITTDPRTGHTVAKDLFKAWAFVVGVLLVVGAAVADYLAGRPVGIDGAVLLLSFAFGITLTKSVSEYFSRRTADGNNNPLAVPGTTEPPAEPVLMPQGPAPSPTISPLTE